MEDLTPSVAPVRFVSRPVKCAIRVELPIELDEALAQGVGLRKTFDRLSEVQRACYGDWVGDGITEKGRRERAVLVCSVLGVLAS
jgi:hypothetical protein